MRIKELLFGKKPPTYKIYINGLGKYIVYYGEKALTHIANKSYDQCRSEINKHKESIRTKELSKKKTLLEEIT